MVQPTNCHSTRMASHGQEPQDFLSLKAEMQLQALRCQGLTDMAYFQPVITSSNVSAGTLLLKLRGPQSPSSDTKHAWTCGINGCKADFHYPTLLQNHFQQAHAADLEGIETIAYLIPHLLRSENRVIALLSHTRGRGINPKPFEAGAGPRTTLSKNPVYETTRLPDVLGEKPRKGFGRRTSTRQSGGSSGDGGADPSYEDNDRPRKRGRPSKAEVAARSKILTEMAGCIATGACGCAAMASRGTAACDMLLCSRRHQIAVLWALVNFE